MYWKQLLSENPVKNFPDIPWMELRYIYFFLFFLVSLLYVSIFDHPHLCINNVVCWLTQQLVNNFNLSLTLEIYTKCPSPTNPFSYTWLSLILSLIDLSLTEYAIAIKVFFPPFWAVIRTNPESVSADLIMNPLTFFFLPTLAYAYMSTRHKFLDLYYHLIIDFFSSSSPPPAASYYSCILVNKSEKHSDTRRDLVADVAFIMLGSQKQNGERKIHWSRR